MSALGAQFMSIDELKGLHSLTPDSGKTVGDTLSSKRKDILEYPEYNSVRKSMKTQGQTEPLGVSNGTLTDGHHRVAIAEDLGWKGMHVSADTLRGDDVG
jgi:hypothetical protein